MEINFGEYITKQYGLLKQVLSYLQPCDLRNAKLVCREWSSAVESLLDKNPISRTFSTGDEKNGIVFSKPLLPALVIHNVLQFHTKKYAKKCKVCNQCFYVCPCKVSDNDTLFISMDSNTPLSNPTTGSYLFGQTLSVFLLPYSPKIQVSTFYAETKNIFKEPVTDEVVSRCISGKEPIKCLLVISKTSGGSLKSKWLSQLLNAIVQRQGLTFALGGGDIHDILCKKGYNFKEDRWKSPGIILIAFRGENVSAHSDLLSDFKMEKTMGFMQEFADRVGPLPEGGSRVAFISQCVDRVSTLVECCESTAFRHFFPEVPQYGFRAYGEYGVRSYSSDATERKKLNKRMKMNFSHAHTTSFVILTFNKV